MLQAADVDRARRKCRRRIDRLAHAVRAHHIVNTPSLDHERLPFPSDAEELRIDVPVVDRYLVRATAPERNRGDGERAGWEAEYLLVTATKR